jgi:Fibrobacter succinogenes major domain (Fib_succ_major).
MKRQILTLLIATMAVLTATAQKKIVVVVDGEEKLVTDVWRVDEIKFIDSDVKTLNDTPDTVDLGLSVRWADRNLGAASPKDKGLLIGWGDTTLTNQSKKILYFPIEKVTDNIEGSQYDVAKVKWNDKWRMPSQKEVQELIDNCTWTWYSAGDSVGYIVTREGYEKHLFLPATGYRDGETTPVETANGYYWTGSWTAKNVTSNAQLLQFSNASKSLAEMYRYMGLAIRPVTGPVKVPVKIDDVKTSNITVNSADVAVTLSGGLEDAMLVGIAYGTGASALAPADATDNNHKVSTTVSGSVTFNFTNLQMHTTYYVMVYVKTSDGYVKSETMSFTTQAKFPVAEAVDLDLPSGIKWASWNMGSTSPLDVPADYSTAYSWGDAEGTFRSLSISDNPYFKDQNGADDHQVNIAGTKYDMATVQWGKGWQLPTLEQFKELINHCDMRVDRFTDGSGKTFAAYKLSSKKDPNKFIYLPEAGLRNSKGDYKQRGEGCYYWTAENVGAGSAIYAMPIQGSVGEGHLLYTCLLAIRPIFVESSDVIINTEKPLTDAGKAAKYVDLGVSVKWANVNIGAASEAYAGDYFAWADTISAEKNGKDYSKEQNSFYKDTNPDGAKLDVNSLELVGTQLPMKYDAASSQWGGRWRLPSKNEWTELINNCDWVWQGNGYRVYKKGSRDTSNSIFLPTTGFKSGTQSYFPTSCQYWSGDINGYYGVKGQESMCFKGDDESKMTGSAYREYGLCIRPVWSN